MPEVLTRKQRKAATRQTLLEAARRCFLRGDAADARVQAIAREAGVAPGTFYVHFTGKEALLDVLLEEFNRDLGARLVPLWVLHQDDPFALLRAAGEVCLDTWREQRNLLAAFAQRAASAQDLGALRDGINPVAAELLAGSLEAVAARLGSALPDAGLVTQGLLGLWTRIGLQYAFGEGVERDAAADLLARLSLGALAAVLPGLPLPPLTS
jgi:AcrR family transcriptional regulator